MAPLIERVHILVPAARQAAVGAINTLQVVTNFEIGRLIVEYEQQRSERAAYGMETLKVISATLTREFGRGFSERNLECFRKFYLLWKDRLAEISQKPSAKSRRPKALGLSSAVLPAFIGNVGRIMSSCSASRMKTDGGFTRSSPPTPDGRSRNSSVQSPLACTSAWL